MTEENIEENPEQDASADPAKIEADKAAATLEEKPPEVKKEKTAETIDKANEAADRLEKANEKLEKNMEIAAKLRVEEILGGKTEAGAEPKEESAEEYTKKVMSGEIRGTKN